MKNIENIFDKVLTFKLNGNVMYKRELNKAIDILEVAKLEEKVNQKIKNLEEKRKIEIKG